MEKNVKKIACFNIESLACELSKNHEAKISFFY